MTGGYPWYDIVEGEEILQGDCIDDCPIIFPIYDVNEPYRVSSSFNMHTCNIIVMSQSCDLKEKKIDYVLVCPRRILDEIPEMKSANSKTREKIKHHIKNGNYPGYHPLSKWTMGEFNVDSQIVDFRHVYNLPFDFIVKIALERGKRLRLLPPYREQLSQAFARFFMRVGLPVNIDF